MPRRESWMHWWLTKCLQERELNNSRQFVQCGFTPLIYHLLLRAPRVPVRWGSRDGTRGLWNPHIPISPGGRSVPAPGAAAVLGQVSREAALGEGHTRASVGNVHRDPLHRDLPPTQGRWGPRADLIPASTSRLWYCSVHNSFGETLLQSGRKRELREQLSMSALVSARESAPTWLHSLSEPKILSYQPHHWTWHSPAQLGLVLTQGPQCCFVPNNFMKSVHWQHRSCGSCSAHS